MSQYVQALKNMWGGVRFDTWWPWIKKRCKP